MPGDAGDVPATCTVLPTVASVAPPVSALGDAGTVVNESGLAAALDGEAVQALGLAVVPAVGDEDHDGCVANRAADDVHLALLASLARASRSAGRNNLRAALS